MNREILFRGKRDDIDKWCFGTYATYESGEACIFSQKFSRYGYEATEICYRDRVIPETIGQYTGLTDKNGVKIFEDDIIQDAKGNDAYIVKCENIAFGCMFRDIEHFGFTDIYSLDYNDDNCLDVIIIGNIHDNPELLEGEK